MKGLVLLLALLLFLTGPASAANLYLYSKLDLPLYIVDKPVAQPLRMPSGYIGSDRAYATTPKSVAVAGRTITTGLAIAGLFQPLGPVCAAGFLLVGLINTKKLIALIKSKPAEQPQVDFIWSKNKQ
jgi:hypothetical protein